jgi:TrmH family RNA methyltransferase
VNPFDDLASHPSRVLLSGFHAVKHAVRFGAELLAVRTTSLQRLEELGAALAPDVMPRLLPLVEQGAPIGVVGARAHWTGVWAVATRREYDLATVLAAPTPAPIVVLEQPRHSGNVGACIRVAAARGAAAVVILGGVDPWSEPVVRGAAGLQYAVPTVATISLPENHRPIIAFDPEGEELRPGIIAPGAILAFGTEREGLSESLRTRASLRLRIPMQPGVSSLNLAVSVGIALYAGR